MPNTSKKALVASDGDNVNAANNVDAVKRGLLLQMARTSPDEGKLLGYRNGPEVWAYEWPTEGPIEIVPQIMDETNSFMLLDLDLEDLGSPEGSVDWSTIEVGQSWKTKRVNPMEGARAVDYAELGWPKSAGPSTRYVTPEEHREILRRLKSSGLTMPGAEVLNVSHTLREIVEGNTKPPEWLLEGLLRRGGAAMVFRPAGVGKTLFVHTLALMVAHGRGVSSCEGLLEAGGHQGAKVLLVDGEMILEDIAERARGLSGALGIPLESLENITVYMKAAQDPRATFVDLVSPEWAMRIIEDTRANGYEVVILDNLSTLSPSLDDENAAVAWMPLNNLIVALKGLGVAVVLVHHAGKGGGYRGSSAIATTLETIVNLERVEGQACDDARFRVKIEKSRARGVPEVEGKVLRLSMGAWVREVDEFGEVARVLGMVRSLRYASQKELADELKFSPMQVSRILAKAEAQGLCDREALKVNFKKAKELREMPQEGELGDFDGEPLDL